jgi:hypothetical protein
MEFFFWSHRRNLEENWVKEVHVAERIRLDASLFPLHLVILADSLLQISSRRERQQGVDEDRDYWSFVNQDQPRACALGCKYFVNDEWNCSFTGMCVCVSVEEGKSLGLRRSVCRCVSPMRSVWTSVSVDRSSLERSGYVSAMS